MKPVPFAYEALETIDEALALLAEHGEDGTVLAGGQSLVPMLNLRLVRPRILVDVNRLPGLDGVTAQPGSRLRLGALARAGRSGWRRRPTSPRSARSPAVRGTSRSSASSPASTRRTAG